VNLLPHPFPTFCTLCGSEIFCEICGSETDNGCFLEVDDDDMEMGSTNSTSNAAGDALDAAFNQAAQQMSASGPSEQTGLPSAAAEEEAEPQIRQQ